MTRGFEASALDDEMAAALATVLRVAESGDGTVSWADVRGDVSRDQWGTMLADGVLVPAGDRFVLDDPAGVREALEDRDFEPPQPAGWSRTDVLAGIGALSLLAGYRVSPIRNAVAGTLDVALGPLAAALPFPAFVVVLAVATAVTSTAVRRRDGTPDMSRLRYRMRELAERLRVARAVGDDAAVGRLDERRRELAGTQVLLLTDHLRVVAWTMLLTIPVFLYLSWLVVAPAHAAAPLVTVAPFLGDIVWSARVVGPVQAWMTWYALCSIVSRLAVRRVVPERTPTTT